MKTKKLLKCMMKGFKVKMTDEYFNANYDEMPNEFTIFQIEDSCVNLHSEAKEEVFHDIPFKAVEMIPIDKEARILTFVNPESNQTLFRGTKKELLQLFIDVKDIADDIQADLDGDNFDEDNVAIENYQAFADKYNK